jgi:hypothetical protein
LGEATGINNGLKKKQGIILIRGSNQDLVVGGSNWECWLEEQKAILVIINSAILPILVPY